MIRTVHVKIMSADNNIFDVAITYSTEEPVELILADERGDQIEVSAIDVFEAFILLRRQVEPQGSKILCAGARTDTYSSGMSRSMSSGLKAYILKFGKSPSADDIVNIFDYAEPHLIGSVEDQQEYYRRWIASMHHNTN